MKGGSNSSPVGFEQNQEQIGIEHAIFPAFSVNIPEVFIFTIALGRLHEPGVLH